MTENTTIVYLDCSSGISGDMTAAALLDLGADETVLRNALASLPIGGYQIRISRVHKSGIAACDFNVILDAEHENHDHDMAYLYGQPDHAHEHRAQSPHAHEHHSLAEITGILHRAQLTDRARDTAIRIFTILAQAEAQAHGTAIDKVHFHEVGAVDSIVDITAAAVCLDNLGITDVIIPALHEGTGTVRCQHGILPVPVPAVANIIQAHGIPLHITHAKGEYVTPTGAAIAAAVRTSGTLPESFTIQKTGIGAGKREQELPGLLRAMIITPQQKTAPDTDTIYKLETNLDDCTGEALGYVMEQLFAAGARDVQYMPVFMKKNRPAYLLTVLCQKDDIPAMESVIFAQTTTIGIRRVRMERTVLRRTLRTLHTPLGSVQVKECALPSAAGTRLYPEYESVAELCKKTGQPYQDVYACIVSEIAKQIP